MELSQSIEQVKLPQTFIYTKKTIVLKRFTILSKLKKDKFW